MILVSIKALDTDRTIATADSCIEGQWDWMQGVIARQFDCDVEDVAGDETDDGDDVLTVRGKPVARVVKDYR
jgi:hypothetical protein